jgi:hypothetical protein
MMVRWSQAKVYWNLPEAERPSWIQALLAKQDQEFRERIDQAATAPRLTLRESCQALRDSFDRPEPPYDPFVCLDDYPYLI